MHIMRWIKALLKDYITAKKRTKSCPIIHILDALGTMQLDERFRQVGYAIRLKRFNAKKPFSEVVQ
jgi:aryl carrier-like protein